MTETKKQPRACGNVHPLPCGLDVDCKVPSDFFKVTLTDEEVYEKYKESFE